MSTAGAGLVIAALSVVLIVAAAFVYTREPRGDREALAGIVLGGLGGGLLLAGLIVAGLNT